MLTNTTLSTVPVAALGYIIFREWMPHGTNSLLGVERRHTISPEYIFALGRWFEMKRVCTMSRTSFMLKLVVEREALRNRPNEEFVGDAMSSVRHKSAIGILDHDLPVTCLRIDASLPEPASHGQIKGNFLHESFCERSELRHEIRVA